MKQLIPVNSHLLIEPITHESFISNGQETFQEKGRVIDNGRSNVSGSISTTLRKSFPEKGDIVYFDAWLAGKYPTGEDGKFHWVVRWEDVKMIEYEDEVSK